MIKFPKNIFMFFAIIFSYGSSQISQGAPVFSDFICVTLLNPYTNFGSEPPRLDLGLGTFSHFHFISLVK